jgi:RNA polymerase sigma factor (sigma-70 family)
MTVKCNVDIATEIFNEYWDFVYSVIRFKVGNEGVTDDLFQNFFLSLVQNPPPPDMKNIKGYLYKAIMNDIIDNARYVKRYHNLMNGYAEYLRYNKSQTFGEDDIFDFEEINNMIDYIDKKLEYNEAKAIKLRFKEELKIREIAERIGVDNTTAWRYISKGLSEIRRFLERGYLQ